MSNYTHSPVFDTVERTVRKSLAAICLLCLAGCASQSTVPVLDDRIGPAEVLAGWPIIGAGSIPSPDVETSAILAVDADMRLFIDKFVDRKGRNDLKLEELIRAIISDGSFDLQYDESTRTAAGTFAAHSGNCLSFTNMFVAMARDAGLEASYQEVDIPPDWSLQNEAYVLNRHVNVNIRLIYGREHVVDFNIDDFRSTYNRRRISDQRAFAHYYSNKGVEQMLSGNLAAAFAMFHTAIGLDRDFTPAWSNLAALYNRAGEPAYAEAAYLEALRLQPGNLVSMSNLSRLYSAQGKDKLSAYYLNRAHTHRQRNPYYRYYLARQAFLARDYSEAIEQLEYAVRKKKWEDSFYFLLGLSYLQQGDEQKARKWLNKAEKVAQSVALKRNYQSKIDLLLSAE